MYYGIIEHWTGTDGYEGRRDSDRAYGQERCVKDDNGNNIICCQWCQIIDIFLSLGKIVILLGI